MRSAGWCAFMEAQLQREEREKKREQWKAEHASLESCPLCGATMYVRESKYGEFLGCSNYPNCKGTKKIKR